MGLKWVQTNCGTLYITPDQYVEGYNTSEFYIVAIEITNECYRMIE